MLTRNTDYIVVIDLECLCWDGGEKNRSFPEIIEIGVCKLNTETLQPSNKSSYLIKNKYGSVSKFCTDLTTITQEQLDKDGISFPEALSRLRQDFQPQTRQWASWGEFDKNRFKEQCHFFNFPYPLSEMHRNVHDEYQMMANLKKRISVKKACDQLKIDFEGTLHRGDDDAWHISKILGMIMEFQRDGYEEYMDILKSGKDSDFYGEL